MIQDDNCLHHYGDPKLERNMVSWKVPDEVRFDPSQKKSIATVTWWIHYCGLFAWLKCGLAGRDQIMGRMLHIRLERGSEHRWSIHSWGLAFDINALEVSSARPLRCHLYSSNVSLMQGYDSGWCLEAEGRYAASVASAARCPSGWVERNGMIDA